MTGWLRNHEKLGYDLLLLLLLLPLTYYRLQYYIPYFIQLKKWVKIMQCQFFSLWLIVQCTITFEAISEERSLGQIALYMDFRGALFIICSGNGSRIIKLFETFKLFFINNGSSHEIYHKKFQIWLSKFFFYPNVIHRP